ncbi:MAG TPA: O-antigen ligase family protein, partial [Iamia sp.]
SAAPVGLGPQAGDPADQERRIAAGLVAALVVTLPLAIAEPVWSSPGGADDWNRSVIVSLFDVVLVATAAWSLLHRPVWTGLLRTRLSRLAAAIYAAGVGVALVAHPSWLGLALALRLGAGLAVVAVAGFALRGSSTRTLVLGAVAGVGVAQAVLGMVQSARGEAFGIQPLEFTGPLYPFGSSFAGRGGLAHPYHLAVLLLVAEGAALLGLRHASRRAPWLAALVVIAAGIGVTYTRAGLLGQLALLAVALLARRAGPTRWAAGAVALGLLLGGVAFGDGWTAKADATTDVDANPTSSRAERLREAEELVRDEPLVGVGPGRYVTAQAELGGDENLPAHNLVAHEAAELGVLGTIGLLGLLAALVRRCVRGGAWALMVALPMAGFLGLDAFPYVFPVGLALSAVWLALVRDAADGVNP